MPSSALAISRMNQKPRELNQGVSQTTELFWTVDGTVPVVCAVVRPYFSTNWPSVAWPPGPGAGVP